MITLRAFGKGKTLYPQWIQGFYLVDDTRLEEAEGAFRRCRQMPPNAEKRCIFKGFRRRLLLPRIVPICPALRKIRVKPRRIYRLYHESQIYRNTTMRRIQSTTLDFAQQLEYALVVPCQRLCRCLIANHGMSAIRYGKQSRKHHRNSVMQDYSPCSRSLS